MADICSQSTGAPAHLLHHRRTVASVLFGSCTFHGEALEFNCVVGMGCCQHNHKYLEYRSAVNPLVTPLSSVLESALGLDGC